MIKGHATLAATTEYFKRNHINKELVISGSNYLVSKMGLGTYLGNFSSEHSEMYKAAIKYALKHGMNYIDTAINYRGMNAEREIGEVVTKMIDSGEIKREECIISSKAGIIPGDASVMIKPVDYLEDFFIKPGILKKEDVYMYENLRLTMNVNYFNYALNLSREHLNLDVIDIHYIHEPELSISVLGEREFLKRLKPVIEFYEAKVEEGIIKEYGFATWDGFQLPDSDSRFINLEKVMDVVKSVKKEHHFRHIMLPFSLDNRKAFEHKTQNIKGMKYNILEAAKIYGVKVNCSGSLGQGRNLNETVTVKDYINYLIDKDIYQFIIGTKQVKHLKENMEIHKSLIET